MTKQTQVRSTEEAPAHQHIEHCLWARNGNQPCPHVQPAQPQQEPVAHQYREMNDDGTWSGWVGCDKPLSATGWRQVRDLYTSPPAQRKPWVGFTDEQIINAMCEDGCERIESFYCVGPVQKAAVWSFARAIEAKLREKNT